MKKILFVDDTLLSINKTKGTHTLCVLDMVRSINDIAHVMGKETIAEFVENAQILTRLREIGVDYAQGYPINKPQPIDELQLIPEDNISVAL